VEGHVKLRIMADPAGCVRPIFQEDSVGLVDGAREENKARAVVDIYLNRERYPIWTCTLSIPLIENRKSKIKQIENNTPKIHKALNADPSRAWYTGACEKSERGEGGGGGPAHPGRAAAQAQALLQAHDATRKLESQIARPLRGRRLNE